MKVWLEPKLKESMVEKTLNFSRQETSDLNLNHLSKKCGIEDQIKEKLKTNLETHQIKDFPGSEEAETFFSALIGRGACYPGLLHVV